MGSHMKLEMVDSYVRYKHLWILGQITLRFSLYLSGLSFVFHKMKFHKMKGSDNVDFSQALLVITSIFFLYMFTN